ncbi:ATP-binding cassette domain-containing protein [Vulgatibacter incomptus]|uniref:ATP-binding cassette domain-containing protein n=1 Tax=Vulgatibacter incomptus TaxID=1391653 RepID=UPI001969DA7C
MLRVDGLHVSYGAIRALHGVSLEVRPGEIVALIGANGAGKSTTLRAISGMIAPSSGSIRLRSEEVTGRKAHELVPKGLAHAPEGRGIFLNLTVTENLRMGAFLRRDPSGIEADLERSFALFPRLRERRAQVAGTLSGGEQQMLAIARALMSRPGLLLLDEPSLGLAPRIVEQIFDILRGVNADGVAMLLVEQNAAKALQLANRAYVLETGRIVMEGGGSDLLASPDVRRAYLGG